MKHLLLSLLLVGGAALALTSNAAAHPLGSFTVNRYSRIEVGPEPHGIAATAAGDMVFITLERKKKEKGELLWFDPVTETVIRRMKIGAKPNQLAVTPDGKIAYVPCDDGTYWVIDTAKAEVVTKIYTGGRPHNTLCSPDGKRMYLAPMERADKVTICDTATHAVLGEIAFSGAVRPIAISADETRFYANVDGLIGFEVADITRRRVIHRVEADPPKDLRSVGSRGHGIGIRPDQKELWMCDVARARCYVFDLTVEPPTQTQSIAMDGDVYWLTFNPDGKTCYVSEREANTVAVVDTAAKQVKAHIPVGKVPKRTLVLTPPAQPLAQPDAPTKPKDAGATSPASGTGWP